MRIPYKKRWLCLLKVQIFQYPRFGLRGVGFKMFFCGLVEPHLGLGRISYLSSTVWDSKRSIVSAASTPYPAVPTIIIPCVPVLFRVLYRDLASGVWDSSTIYSVAALFDLLMICPHNGHDIEDFLSRLCFSCWVIFASGGDGWRIWWRIWWRRRTCAESKLFKHWFCKGTSLKKMWGLQIIPIGEFHVLTKFKVPCANNMRGWKRSSSPVGARLMQVGLFSFFFASETQIYLSK